MTNYKDRIAYLDSQMLYYEQCVSIVAHFTQYPPLTRGEMIELEIAIEGINSAIDEIVDGENYLYQGGAN